MAGGTATAGQRPVLLVHREPGPAACACLAGSSDRRDRSRVAAERASELFLTHGLFRRRDDGAVITPSFLQLHHPCDWHYDILFGLEVLAEAGHLRDPRCTEALEQLRAKRLPDGGFPAEHRYYRTGRAATSGRSLVDWGPTSRRRMNEWATVRTLAVLRRQALDDAGAKPGGRVHRLGWAGPAAPP
jgi:hypothetical protein